MNKSLTGNARFFFLISLLFSASSCLPFFGGNDDTPKSRVSVAFPLPSELGAIAQEDLFVNLSIYENKKDFLMAHQSDLAISNGLIEFEEYKKSEALQAFNPTNGDIANEFGNQNGEPKVKPPINEIVLKSKSDYTFVIIFKVHTGSGVLLPVAYISKILSFTNPSVLVSFAGEDVTYDNPSDILNDLSADFNVNGIVLPNLDDDGDFSSNLSEFLDNTSPNDSQIYPTPTLPRCGNKIVNTGEECDDGNTDDTDTCNAKCQKAAPIIRIISPQTTSSTRDTVIILAEASSEWGVRSLVLTEPSGIEDKDFSSETFQGSWDTTNLPDDEDASLILVARDKEGRERTATLTIKVDNVPNIVSFGTPVSINNGQSTNLTWEVSNYSTLSINNLDGGSRKLFTAVGSTTVNPTTTTTYTLTATRTNAQGKSFTVTRDVMITVYGAPSASTFLKTPGFTGTGDTLFAWNAVSPGSSACASLTYNLTVKKPNVGSIRGETVFTVEDIPQESFDVSTLSEDKHLEPRSFYEVQVTAKNSCGLSTSSNFTPFSTLDNGLAGWWRFENSSTLGLNTSNPNKNNGTLTDGHAGDGDNQPVQTTGVKTASSAILFENFDPYINLGDDDSLKNLTTAITVEAWVKPSELKNAVILSHGDANDGWVISQNGRDLEITLSNGASVAMSSIPDAFSVNEWKLVAFSYDGNRVRTYVNGYLRDSPSFQGEINYGALTKTMIATSESELGNPPPANLFFKGSIDEVSIYNRALSSAQIRANCRRNDSGNVCVALGVPEPVFAVNGVTLPPHRAFISWKQVDYPAGKNVTYYTLCYVANGDISGPADCLNSKTTTLPYTVIESLTPSSLYSWKVFANYNDGSRSVASSVWNFETDNSLIHNWNFSNEGGMRDLNGSSSETVPNILSTGFQSAVTIEARARVRNINASFNPSAIVSGGGADGWRMQTTNISGKIMCVIPTNNPGDTHIVSSFGFRTDRFNHVVCTFNQIQQKKRIFMNTHFGDRPSTDVDEVTASGQMNYSSSDVTIGDDPNTTIDPFNGFLDEISIYNQALSADEVKNNFCALEVLAGSSLPSECQ